MSAHVAPARCPPKYKQHAGDQLSPFVLSQRFDIPNLLGSPMIKKSNDMRSRDRGGHIIEAPRPIQLMEHVISSQSRTEAQKCTGALS
ncbi:hypothetical protein TNCV_1949401 [Trichonephila clavipes]|nr:hypothetical protein TNCV_1949401 [Trichonephila clavipes]